MNRSSGLGPFLNWVFILQLSCKISPYILCWIYILQNFQSVSCLYHFLNSVSEGLTKLLHFNEVQFIDFFFFYCLYFLYCISEMFSKPKVIKIFSLCFFLEVS